MNKIFNINLGGYPFTIDDIAYKHLTQYLQAIRNHFKNSEGCDEIISDIEARMAELFLDNLKGQSIVTHKDVESVIKTMGTPADFGAESLEDESFTNEPIEGKKYKTGKRLFRNTEDQVIGGVCSGIASYFGVTDPLWIRLAFVLITISGGVGVLAYLILWMILPVAKTAGDKLLMRGEPINVSNIAKTVEQEIEDLSKQITELGNEFKSKKKSIKGSVFIFAPKAIITKGFSLLGKTVKGVFRLIRTILKPFFFLTIGLIIFVLGISWVSLLYGISSATPYAGYFLSGFSPVGYIGLANIFVVAGIPLLALILLMTRFLTSYRIERGWLKTAWTIWGVNLVSLGLITMNTVNMNSARSSWSEIIPIEIDSSIPLTLGIGEKPFDYSFNQFGELMSHDGKLYVNNMEIDIVKSESGEFKLLKEVSSRGKNQEVAEKWASKVIHQPVIKGNQIIFPPYYQLKKGSKFRFQNVNYKLMVPADARIDFVSQKIHHYIDDMQKDKDFEAPYNFTKYEWVMEENGLASPNYQKMLNFNKIIENVDFTKLNIKGDIKVIIEKSDEFKGKIVGKQSMVEKVEIIQQNDMLSFIIEEDRYASNLRLYLSIPELKSLHTKKTKNVRIEGFDQDQMEIQHTGNYDLKAFINVKNLDLLLDGNSDTELTGTGELMNLTVFNSAKFMGENYVVNNVKMKGRRYSLATLHVKDLLEYEVDHEYKMKVYGDPETKRIPRKETVQ